MIQSSAKSGQLVRVRVRVPAGDAGKFSSPELTICADSYSVFVPPRVTAVARKRPRSSVKSAGGRLHLKTHDPTKSEWADYAIQT